VPGGKLLDVLPLPHEKEKWKLARFCSTGTLTELEPPGILDRLRGQGGRLGASPQLREPPEPLHATDLPLPTQWSFADAFAYCTGTIVLITTIAAAAVTRAKVIAVITTPVNAILDFEFVFVLFVFTLALL
jgi:hypothetical protein